MHLSDIKSELTYLSIRVFFEKKTKKKSTGGKWEKRGEK